MLESKLPLHNRIKIDRDDYVFDFENVKIGEHASSSSKKNIAQTYLISRRMHRGTTYRRMLQYQKHRNGRSRKAILSETDTNYYLTQWWLLAIRLTGDNEFGIDDSKKYTWERSADFANLLQRLFLESAATRILRKKLFRWDQKRCFTKR